MAASGGDRCLHVAEKGEWETCGQFVQGPVATSGGDRSLHTAEKGEWDTCGQFVQGPVLLQVETDVYTMLKKVSERDMRTVCTGTCGCFRWRQMSTQC